MNGKQNRLLLVCVLIVGVLQLGLAANSEAFGELITISTDTTWRAIGPVGNQEGTSITSVGLAWEAANPGWNTSLTFDDTDDAGWQSATDPWGVPHIWVDGDTWNGSTPSYYRKVFELPETPSSALLGYEIDDDVFIYINGQLVISDTDRQVTIETGINVTSLLIQGKNLIAVKAHDSYGANEGLKINLDIEVVGPATYGPVEWKRNKHWYEIIVIGPAGISWPEAQADAVNQGGHLATITSDKENDFVFDLTIDTPGAWVYSAEWAAGPWLGGYQDLTVMDYSEPSGGWRWVTGEPWEYPSWLSGQPDNWLGLEDYLIFWGLGNPTPTWNDGADTHHSYVIEYEPGKPGAVQWKRNRHWYEVVVVGPTAISWADAQDAATAKGGYLATITSKRENDFVFNLTVDTPGAWIYSAEWAIGPWLGGSDADSEGNWQWVNGERWKYTNWLSGQPDNWNDEDYVLFWGLGDIAPTWNDGDIAPSYVIEYD